MASIQCRMLVAAALAVGLAMATPAGAAAPECKMVRIADWPVRMQRNHLVVDGTINGQAIGVMLDTGSTTTLILRSAAVRLGLTRHEARGRRMFGLGGETTVEAAQVDEFRIGTITRKNWRVMVAGERDLGEDVAVILGDDFFHQVDVEFDLKHAAVRLYQPRDCAGVSLAFWATSGASEVEIDAVDPARPQILLTVRINGQPIRALLDSGASGSVITRSDAARLGVTPDTPGVTAVGRRAGLGERTVGFWLAPFQSFAIDNETITNPSISFGDVYKDATYTSTGSRLATSVESMQPMLLGADFIRVHRMLVAHSQRKIYFTYEGGPVFRPLRPPAESHPP